MTFTENRLVKMKKEKTYSKFIGFVSRLGETFLEPGKMFERLIAEKKGFLEPLVLVLIFHGVQGALIGSLIAKIIITIFAFLGSLLGIQNAIPSFVFVIPVITAIVGIICTLLLWVILAGIAHIIAKYIFKGVGSFTQLFKLYGYASVPNILAIFATLLMGVDFFAFLGYSLVLCFASIFWVVLIMVVAVEKSHQIDPGKAFISAFIGPIVILLILLAFAGLFLSMLFGGISL